MTTTLTASQLGRQHHGRIIRIPHGSWTGHRDIVLIGIRRWEFEGVQRTELLALDGTGRWAGVAHSVAADAMLTILEESPRTRRRPRLVERNYRSASIEP